MSTATPLPQPVSNVMLAFPADVSDLLPDYAGVPEEFKGYGGNPWVKLTEEWFYKGLDGDLIAKDGVDATAAGRHIAACLGSFQPKHEHKIAGVAYLMSLWFERYEPAQAAAAD